MKAPFYKIWLNETDISDMVEGLDFEQSVEQDNLLKFVVHKENAKQLADNEDLITGATIKFRYGYKGGEVSTTRQIRVTDIETEYAKLIRLTVTCLDKGNAMKKVPDKKVWKQVTVGQVAQVIADRYGMTLEVTTSAPTKVWDSLPQASMSDLELLRYMVKRETGGDWIVFVKDNTLMVTRRGLQTPSVLTLTYGNPASGIVSFKPKLKESSQDPAASGTLSTVVDAISGKETAVSVDGQTEDKTGTTNLFKQVYDEAGNFLGKSGILPSSEVQTPSADVEEAKAVANHKKKAKALKTWEATLVIEGKPNLSPGTVITIDGVAKRHAGNWYVTKVRDTPSKSGYVTSLELNRDGSKKNLGQGRSSDANTSTGPDSKADKVKLRVFDGFGDFLGYSSSDTDAQTPPKNIR